jgi:hypothetical protein
MLFKRGSSVAPWLFSSARSGGKQKQDRRTDDTPPPYYVTAVMPHPHPLPQGGDFSAQCGEVVKHIPIARRPDICRMSRLFDLLQVFAPLRIALETMFADVGHCFLSQIMISPPVTGTTAPVM